MLFYDNKVSKNNQAQRWLKNENILRAKFGLTFNLLVIAFQFKNPLKPKICYTYPTMMTLGTVIPYLKIWQIYRSHDAPFEFW